jgi:hypothetical protein
MSPNNAATPLRVAVGSEVYSSTMAASHEFFDLTGQERRELISEIVIGDG